MAETETTELHPKINVEERENCVRVLDVEISSEEVDEELKKVFKEIGRSAEVPGFRRGKAPRKLVETRFIGAAREETSRRLVSASFEKAVEEHNLKPIGDPSVEEAPKCEAGKPLSYRITLEVAPSVKLGEYRGLKLQRQTRPVKDQDVENVLTQLQERHPTYVIEEERGIETTDMAILDLDGKVDGKPLEGGKSENLSYMVGSGFLFEGLDEALAGKKAGEQFDMPVTLPENMGPELAGKNANFSVTIKEVKRRQLPEINDDLAKLLDGDMETLAELNDKIREDLEESRRNAFEERLRNEAVQQVVKASEFDLPETLVESMAHQIFLDEASVWHRAGMSQEEILQRREELRDQIHQRAENQVMSFQVIQAVQGRENISASDEDVDQAIETRAGSAGTPEADLEKLKKDERLRGSIQNQLLTRKAIDIIIENAEIETVEASDDSEENQDKEEGD